MKYLVIVQDGSRKEFCLEARQSDALAFLLNVILDTHPEMSLQNHDTLKLMLKNSDENLQSVSLNGLRFSFMFAGF